MTNMSYCRFSNTLYDLQDCYYNLNDDLSDDEKDAKKRLVELCKKIVKRVESNENIEIEEDYH